MKRGAGGGLAVKVRIRVVVSGFCHISTGENFVLRSKSLSGASAERRRQKAGFAPGRLHPSIRDSGITGAVSAGPLPVR